MFKRLPEDRPCPHCGRTPFETAFGTVARRGRIERACACKECNANKKRLAYVENPEPFKTRQREYEQQNPECLKRWRKNNPEKVRAQQKRRWTNYLQPRLATDLEFKIITNLRKYAGRVIKTKKSARTEQLLGCPASEFLVWIESQFSSGMCWGNYGRNGWHLDHKRPLASFSDLTNPAQQKEAFHFSNYQPLWAADNIRKKDAWIPE